MVVIKHCSFPVPAGTKARLAKAWCRLHLPISVLLEVAYSARPGSEIPGLPTQRGTRCVSHVLVLAELKSLKRGDFRLERKKHWHSPCSLQRPREPQVAEGRCVTSAAATGCNLDDDEEMLSDASFLSHYSASGRKPSC